MINILFSLLIILGIVYSIFNNSIDELLEIILKTPRNAYDLLVNVSVSLVFWNGILEVLKNTNLLSYLSKFISIFIKPLFPTSNKEALEYISGNIMANVLGLGSAATPFGLKAMEELNKINKNKTVASKEMITLLILNTSGITLLPTTIISLRAQYNAKIITQIIPLIITSSIITTIIAILLDYIVRRMVKWVNI